MDLSPSVISAARRKAQLCEDFCDRARKMGRNMGFSAVALEELPVSKQREPPARMKDEAERLSARLPDGAHVVLLDARGKGMTSEDFAEMLGALRDVGTKDLAFVIGGPDGLAPLPGKKAGPQPGLRAADLAASAGARAADRTGLSRPDHPGRTSLSPRLKRKRLPVQWRHGKASEVLGVGEGSNLLG